MAVSVSVATGPEVPGNRKMTSGSITFDSSYVTGGEAVTIGDLGFTRLDFMCVSSGQGYVAIWDGSTTAPKLLLYRQTAATGALVEVPNATDVSTISVRVLAFGV